MTKIVYPEDVDRFFAELKGKFTKAKWKAFVDSLPDIVSPPSTEPTITYKELVSILGKEETDIKIAQLKTDGINVDNYIIGVVVQT